MSDDSPDDHPSPVDDSDDPLNQDPSVSDTLIIADKGGKVCLPPRLSLFAARPHHQRLYHNSVASTVWDTDEADFAKYSVRFATATPTHPTV